MSSRKFEDTFINNPDNHRGSDALMPPADRSDEFPYDKPITYGRDGTDGAETAIWEVIGSELGIGMGDDGIDAIDLEFDCLKNDFRSSFDDSLALAQQMSAKSLFSVLNAIDPEFVAQVFAPEDDSEMLDIYTLWGRRSVGEE